jgi:hypothetical protein
VLTSSDKLTGFLRQFRIWKLQVEKKNLQMFPSTSKVDPHGDVTSELILNHLLVLVDKMVQYIPSITVAEYDWVRNPYDVSPEPTTNLPLEKEELAEFQSDRTLQLKYGEPSLLKFWMLAKEEYPEIAVEAVNTLLHFSTTYCASCSFRH